MQTPKSDRPLENRMAHGKRSQTDSAEPHFLGMRRQGREHGDRFQARLVDQAVADPHRFEDARLLCGHRGFDQLIDVGEAEERAAIGQADTPFDRQVAHGFAPIASVRRTVGGCQAKSLTAHVDLQDKT
jgi:hypothetical protein